MPEDLAVPSSLSASIENSRIAAPFQSVARTKVLPDLLSLPRKIPFGLTAAEYPWCLDPQGSPMAPRLRRREPQRLSLFWWAKKTEPLPHVRSVHLQDTHTGPVLWGWFQGRGPRQKYSSVQSPMLRDSKYEGEGYEHGGQAHGLEGWVDRNTYDPSKPKYKPIGEYELHLEEKAENRKFHTAHLVRKKKWTPTEKDVFDDGGFGFLFRASRKSDTEETRAAFAAEKARLDGIIEKENYWSPLDPPEYTRIAPNGRKINTKNERFKRDAFAYSRLHGNHDGLENLAAQLEIEFETVRKVELNVINKDKLFPATPLPEDLKDDTLASLMGDWHNVVLVHVTLDRGRWFKLDMDKHDTYAAAIEEVRWKSQDEAWKKAGVPSRLTDTRTPEDDPALARAFKEVVVRYEEAFNPKNLFILDLWSPLAVAIAEDEWGTEYHIGATSEAA